MPLPQKVSILFFLFLFIPGFSVVRDYGVSWDEEAQIEIGKKSYDYLVHDDHSLLTYCDRDYGVGFELPVYALQQLFTTKVSQYYFRHFCVHGLFLLGLFFLFKTQLIFYAEFSGKYWISLLSIFMIVLSPRIFADSFYNSKDIVLLAVSCINFYTLIHAVDKPSKASWFLHGLSSAYLLDIRIIGLVNVMLTIGVLTLFILTHRSTRKQQATNLFIYLLTTITVLYLIWPYLYQHPGEKFISIIKSMAAFRWHFDVLFMGSIINSTKLPSYYTLVWIGLTTPILFLVGSIIGLLFSVRKFFLLKRFNEIAETKQVYILSIVGLALGPIAATILFNSVMYDAWRQLFYVYPYLIMLSVFGFYKLIVLFPSRTILRYAFFGLTGVQCIAIIVFIIQAHPHENVYFNEIWPRKNQALVRDFERDYWGLSYKQALIKASTLLKTNDDTLHILCAHTPGKWNSAFIPANLQGRVKVYLQKEIPDSMKQHMDYFITTYRETPNLLPKCMEKIWSLSVQQSDVVAIYDLRQDKQCYERR